MYMHSIALFQGTAKVNSQLQKLGNKDSRAEAEGVSADPTCIALAYKKHRFYLFTRREPEHDSSSGEGRDVFNEKVVTL